MMCRLLCAKHYVSYVGKYRLELVVSKNPFFFFLNLLDLDVDLLLL